MTAAGEKGSEIVPTPGGEQLRAALRQALDRLIDPDDDTMPTLNRADGGFTWVSADSVIDDLMKIAETLFREDNVHLRARLLRLDNTVRRLRAQLGAEVELREERTALYDLWRSKAHELLDKARKGESP